MCKRNNDALFFTCSLIEQLGRSLHMRRGKVAAELGEAGIQTLYRNADILHCEPIEKVADDVITEFSLQGGNLTILPRQDIQSPMCGRWERSMQGSSRMCPMRTTS